MTCTASTTDTPVQGREMMRIGDLAARCGVSVRSLRYYEQQGLLQSERTGGGQRVYPPSAVARVGLIQELFAAGIPSRVVAQLLPCVTTGRATVSMLAQMRRQSEAIEERLRDLSRARERLEGLVAQVVEAGVHPDDAGSPAGRSAAAAPVLRAG